MRLRHRKSRVHNRRREVCTDRSSPLFDKEHFNMSCKGKVGHETEWQAKNAADYAYEKNGAELSWYKCPYCGKWHLTSCW
jgi:hypothetical protein